MAAPTITSGTMSSCGCYVTVVFSEGVYTTSAHTTPIIAADFTATIGGSNKVATAVAVHSIYKNDGTALASTGGESTVRMMLTWTGIPNGNETVTITVASGTAVYNVTADAMAAGQTTGALSLSGALTYTRTLYVSKAGVDTNDGITPTSAKLTLGGAKTVLAQGEDKVWVGIGTYTETWNWDSTGTYTTMTGDYDGAIFGSAAGDIIVANSGNYTISNVRKMERMILSHTAGGQAFVRGSTLRCSFEYLNCTLRCHSTGSLLFGATAGHDPSFVTMPTISLTNIAVDTGNLTCQSYSGETTGSIRFLITNLDTATAGKTLNNLNTVSLGVYDDINILYSTLIYGGCSDIVIKNSALKQVAATSVLYTSDGNFPTLAKPIGRGNVLIKDCTLLDSSGNDFDVTNNAYTEVSYIDLGASSGGTSVMQLNYANMDLYNSLLLDNINSNGKRQILFRDMAFLDGDTETYNSKDVLYYHHKAAGSAKRQLLYIKIDGLSASTSYDLTFSYKKAANSSDAGYNIRFGVLTGNMPPKANLYTTPANALTYADYASADHTYDTWYDKTLTFSTTSDTNEEYYLAFYSSSDISNFKITKPAIAVHT